MLYAWGIELVTPLLFLLLLRDKGKVKLTSKKFTHISPKAWDSEKLQLTYISSQGSSDGSVMDLQSKGCGFEPTKSYIAALLYPVYSLK